MRATFSLALGALLSLAAAAQVLPGTLAAGSSHCLVLAPDGSLRAWGYNIDGQLGQTQPAVQPTPAQPGTATTYTQVAAGTSHTLALRADGTLWSWGANQTGQLGQGNNTTQYVPTQVGVTGGWKQVAAGSLHSVGLRADGTLWAWGLNINGQLGLGTSPSRNIPVNITASSPWLSVAAGARHTLAVRADGTLWAWGDNQYGQLGEGTTTSRSTPVQVGSATNWRAAAGGERHSLALRTDGTLWAWGDNSSGQLGEGTTNPIRTTPVQVGTTRPWRQVAASQGSSAAIAADGTLWAWGSNANGQLGDGTSTTQNAPVQVGTSTWASVALGDAYTLAMQANGTVWTWGSNQYGQLGDGTTNNKLLPAQVASVAGLPTRSLSAGLVHSLAVRPDGRLLAWGSNANGQLGDGTTTDRRRPTLVGTGSNWVQVAASRQAHSLALQADGTLWAWGYNVAGQLGDGTTTDRLAPVPIGTARRWRQVWGGESYSLALAADGTLWAWGTNGSGQLGSSPVPNVLLPAAVSLTTTWRTATAGFEHTLAVRADGTLWSWGQNRNGQLGDGTTTSHSTPAQVGTLTDWAALSATNHSLALRANGTLWAWGSNNSGQVGDGTLLDRPAPTQVGIGGTAWTQLAAGGLFSVALQPSGTLWSWGDNFNGSLGDGTTADRPAPTREATSGVAWLTVAAGQSFALARTPSGYAVASTGYNGAGQLGDGTITSAVRYDHATTALPVRPSTLASASAALYPNPALGPARLHGAGSGAGVSVFDAVGRLVLQTTTDATGEAPLTLPAGLYLVRVGTQTLRLSVR
jgi:alpha-tubulin suppressor-like RCC1 family protein